MDTEQTNSTQHSKACIFCFRTDLETTFSNEHIIPRSIGGRLELEQVCAECNNRLGHDVDVEILKLPETLQALNSLKIPHNREGILRSYYNITGEVADGQRNVRAKGSGFEPLPGRMPDGSILTPDERFAHDLRKRVHRDERLNIAGLTTQEIDEELKSLLALYKDCEPGESIESPRLGLKLVRRQEKVTIRIQARDQQHPEKLMAKIAYEFLFFLGGRELLINRQVAEPLFRAIQGENSNNPAFFLRLDPLSETYVPTHTIELHTDRGMTEVYINLFGRIVYRVTTTALLPTFLRSISDKYGIPNIIGIHYQQRLPNEMSFSAVTSEGEYIWLGQVDE